MKKPITYILIFLMFIAVNFQSVCYLMWVSGHTLELAPNFLSEEERHESEESDTDFKKKEVDFLHFNTEHLFVSSVARQYERIGKVKFVSSNFSGKIYTPPELTLI